MIKTIVISELGDNEFYLVSDLKVTKVYDKDSDKTSTLLSFDDDKVVWCTNVN